MLKYLEVGHAYTLTTRTEHAKSPLSDSPLYNVRSVWQEVGEINKIVFAQSVCLMEL